jgi:hypothetical protein
MSYGQHLPLNELPQSPPDPTPGGVKSSILDAATEFGKIDPSELHFSDTLTLAMIYGMMRTVIETTRKRREQS